MRRKTEQYGYSLIEALVVVAIIGIITLVAVPNFMSMYRSSKMKTALRQFTSDIRAARQRAVTNNDQTMVSIGTTATEKTSYWIFERRRNADGTWAAWVLIPNGKRDLEANTSDANRHITFSSVGFDDYDTTDGATRKDIIFQQNGTIPTADFPVTAPLTPTVVISTTDDIPVNHFTITFSPTGQFKTQ